MLTEDPFSSRLYFKFFQLKGRHLIKDTQHRQENAVRLRFERIIELKQNSLKHQRLMSTKDLNQPGINSLFEKRFHQHCMDHARKKIESNNVFDVQESQSFQNIFIEDDTKEDSNYISSTSTNFSEQTLPDLADNSSLSSLNKRKTLRQQQQQQKKLQAFRYDRTQFRHMIDSSYKKDNLNSKGIDYLLSQKSFSNDNSDDTTDDDGEKVELPDIVRPTMATVTNSTDHLCIKSRSRQLQKFFRIIHSNVENRFDSRNVNSLPMGEDNVVKIKNKFEEIKLQEQKQTKKMNINNNLVKTSNITSKIRKKLQSAPSSSIIDVKSTKTDAQRHQFMMEKNNKNDNVDNIVERQSNMSFVHAVTSSKEIDDYLLVRKNILGIILKHLKEMPDTERHSKWTTFREIDEKFSESVLNVYPNFERIIL
ncbi:unnamed protein product [Didymodactylos carnosus]|uniref:Uncharacterized protein n=1 Tax=Didymodactylos carnosus TaxID=1234261 RepID=A0A815MW42_9BILA|nr:unnamed protein product [Didymodactylos carnosus]CAF4309036.1 unnamed protein product [Didymodactylos carnosus]